MPLRSLEPSRRLRILFVDDEKNLLEGLRRGMYGMRAEWDMSFASSGAEALTLVQERTPDVVVSDMRMPGMNGRDLLIEVKKQHPQAIRFILSGYSETSSVMQVAGIAHQYLSKPCEGAVLKTAIARTAALRVLLEDETLISRIGAVDSLPSVPSIYQEIVSCLQGPPPELAQVARIISADVAMTTVVLKLANSAFFGARQSFRTADRAVSFLGLETIASLVLAHSIFNDFSVAERSGLNLEQLWHHSLNTGTGIRALARHENWSQEDADEAFLAGVLHDVGKLVLATRSTGKAAEGAVAPPDGASPAAWDADHAAVGAYLLGLWGFSDRLVEAVAFHHSPSKAADPRFGLAGLLHIANCLAIHDGTDDETITDLGIENGYLESMGLSGRVVEWRAIWAKSAA